MNTWNDGRQTKETKAVEYRVLTTLHHQSRSVGLLTILFLLAFAVVVHTRSCLGTEALSLSLVGAIEDRLLSNQLSVLSSDEVTLIRNGVGNSELTEAARNSATDVLLLHFRNGSRQTPKLLPDELTNQVLANVAHNERDPSEIRGASAGLVVAFNSGRTDVATKQLVDGIWDSLLAADATTRAEFVKFLPWGQWDGTDDRLAGRIRTLYEVSSDGKEDSRLIIDCVLSAVIEHRTCEISTALKIFTEIAGSEKCSREDVKLILGRVSVMYMTLEYERYIDSLQNDHSIEELNNQP